MIIYRRTKKIYENTGGISMLQLNTAGLHQVMRDFYTLTNMRIVILDA